ncbi:hypothetical protein BGX28_009590 [Mortierella sp. GBA30]|nr:hypothetical protein BGX28_009590 [Mortierella sp. GBA30]
MDMSAIQNFELRKYAPMSDQLQQAQQQQLPMTNIKTQSIQIQPPRVLDYKPHFGPEGQPFNVTLQSSPDRPLRIGFGTLVVDTKQYAANGYVTLSCTVPSFAIIKWFASKVPLYILHMENDAVLESWGPFGDYTYYDDINGNVNVMNSSNNNNKRVAADKMMYDQSMSHSPKKQHMAAELDLSHTQLNQMQSQQQQSSPLTSTALMDGMPSRHNDYATVSSTNDSNNSLYSQIQQPASPYTPRAAITTPSYARSGYYNTNQMISSHMPSYSQQDLAVSSTYAMTSAGCHNSNYIGSHHAQQQQVMPSSSSYMASSHSSSMASGMSVGNYNQYASMLNKANLKFTGNMDDMAINWSGEEWDSHRRLVQFWRRQDGNDIHCNFAPVAPADRQPNSIVVSCIYWAEKNDCFLTSVDCIYLLESLIAVRFTVEEKNRIRRNLEGFRPITVSKCKPESAEFFKLIMSFPNPKPRNIEKDVKVFPWKVLSYALKKIISKYTASYSSTASIQTDAFHNANFPHGSTLPLTPQQQSILESSIIA